MVTTQIGNLFAHRTDRRSFGEVWRRPNRLLWIGVATELAVIAAIVYLPPLQRIVGTAPFPAWLWLPLFAVAPALLVVDELRKTVLRQRDRRRIAATPDTPASVLQEVRR